VWGSQKFNAHELLCLKFTHSVSQSVARFIQCMNRDTGSYFLPTSYGKLLLPKPAHFHQNDTSRRRVDSLSVLKKASDDVATSVSN